MEGGEHRGDGGAFADAEGGAERPARLREGGDGDRAPVQPFEAQQRSLRLRRRRRVHAARRTAGADGGGGGGGVRARLGPPLKVRRVGEAETATSAAAGARIGASRKTNSYAGSAARTRSL